MVAYKSDSKISPSANFNMFADINLADFIGFLTILAIGIIAQTLGSGKVIVSWADEDSSGLTTSVALLIYRIKYFCQPTTAPTRRATIQDLQTDSFMLQNLTANDGLFPKLMTS